MNSQCEIAIRSRLPDGSVAIDKLAGVLLITKSELAAATGLPTDAVWRTARSKSSRTQKRMRELVKILDRVMPWTGHPRIAYAWYRSQPLPSFGSATAEDLLKVDRSRAVEAFLDRVADGGYA